MSEVQVQNREIIIEKGIRAIEYLFGEIVKVNELPELSRHGGFITIASNFFSKQYLPFILEEKITGIDFGNGLKFDMADPKYNPESYKQWRGATKKIVSLKGLDDLRTFKGHQLGKNLHSYLAQAK